MALFLIQGADTIRKLKTYKPTKFKAKTSNPIKKSPPRKSMELWRQLWHSTEQFAVVEKSVEVFMTREEFWCCKMRNIVVIFL